MRHCIRLAREASYIMSMNRSGNIGLGLIAAMIVVGIVIGIWQPVGLEELLDWGYQAADIPALTVAVLVVMALLFTFGLPGSFGLWLIAPFHPPLIATALLLASSLVGAIGAYFVSARLGKNWEPSGFSAKIVGMLEKQGGLMTQTALRVLPGFPHSVVNFAGGMLGLPLLTFIIAAIIGLAIKWAVYATAVHGVVDAVETGEAVKPETVVPLIVLSALLLLGTWFKHKVMANGWGK